jgi:hypothetical protein
MGLTYVFSTLAGYVSLEGARQTARRGIERATYARAEAKEARTAIEALTNPTALRAWADGHGFVETARRFRSARRSRRRKEAASLPASNGKEKTGFGDRGT